MPHSCKTKQNNTNPTKPNNNNNKNTAPGLITFDKRRNLRRVTQTVSAAYPVTPLSFHAYSDSHLWNVPVLAPNLSRLNER